MHGFNCAEACGILVSLTKDQTQVPCIGRQILKPLDHQKSLDHFYESCLSHSTRASPSKPIPLDSIYIFYIHGCLLHPHGLHSGKFLPCCLLPIPMCLGSWRNLILFLFSNLQPRPKPLVFNNKFGIPGSDQTLLSSSWASGSFYSQLLCKTICLIQPQPSGKEKSSMLAPLFGPRLPAAWVTQEGMRLLPPFNNQSSLFLKR